MNLWLYDYAKYQPEIGTLQTLNKSIFPKILWLFVGDVCQT